MDFLKAEIERKKRAIAQTNVMAPDKKYFKRGDLSAKQEEDYRKKYGPQKPDSPPKVEEDVVRDQSTSQHSGESGPNMPALPRVEVIRRLRERLEPILVFGEEEEEACQRLRQIEMDEPEPVQGIQMVKKINQGDIAHDHKVVNEFIKLMLKLWGAELQERDEATKMSIKGKIEAVTNAGIHARPARENIYSKHVAHVLNDETQRKYIQGLKRLFTKAQQYYPTDPSRSIDFTRKE
ncbi:hypothetical protein TCAL_02792 [Tigriopus californicus]|uniref:Pre-mRNA-splicing factor 18 n=1 Tax=Tigriopus californicus TaxID=6832 RepID=A0A553NZL3_TIGCA|nr:hypothetical protein TCAL_02792 [Tigriopus californicus]|eukprot:TCALIF_02792-PA protein Name:"Similar to Prpf18 Pre-mRNA-splicing factor 18 (Mus musculus)" AED:0.16 eAED:0.16 QI:158/0.33/0.25/1/0.66/0.25/4/0/235